MWKNVKTSHVSFITAGCLPLEKLDTIGVEGIVSPDHLPSRSPTRMPRVNNVLTLMLGRSFVCECRARLGYDLRSKIIWQAHVNYLVK